MRPITVEMVMEKLAQERVIPTSSRLMASGVGTDTSQGRVYDTSSLRTQKKAPQASPSAVSFDDAVGMVQGGKGAVINRDNVARNVRQKPSGDYVGTGDTFAGPGRSPTYRHPGPDFRDNPNYQMVSRWMNKRPADSAFKNMASSISSRFGGGQ